MKPFCPVCRKRVEDKRNYTGSTFVNAETYCPECGVVFCPNISERLAPKPTRCEHHHDPATCPECNPGTQHCGLCDGSGADVCGKFGKKKL